jgi:fumarate hydratase subunit beta
LYFGSKNVLNSGWAVWNIAAFTTFLSCYGKLAVKSSKAAKLFNSVQKANVSWKRIRPLLTEPPEETEEKTAELHAGDYVYITGTIYVARDAAHKRMMEVLERGEELPIDILDSTIYYMGPSPAREGRPIGSAGPTTATRMDKYAPTLLDLGEKAMIGKGKRSKEVIDAIIRNKAVYFAAIGGAGALLSKCITKSEIVCYEDLGAEAIRKLEVKDFPVIVVIGREWH